MRLSKVRDYLKQQIRLEDTSAIEWPDAFNTENIPRNLGDKSFHIAYSAPSITRGQRSVDYNVVAICEFFFKGQRNTQTQLDDAMDKINRIGLNCSSTTAVSLYRDTDNFPIQNCNIISQVPTPLENNDNALIITIELEMLITFSNC